MKQTSLLAALAAALLLAAPALRAGEAADPKQVVDPKELRVEHSEKVADPYAFHNGFYVTAAGGAEFRNQASENTDTFTSFKPGYIVGGGVGYRFESFRFELEGNYADNSNNTLSAPGIGRNLAQGHINLYDALFNVYYDYRIGQSRWAPFIGAGVGAIYSRINNLWFANGTAAGAPPLNGTSGAALTWDLKVGVSYLLTPHVDLFTDYRYQDTGELHFSFNNAFVPSANPDGALTHSIEVGVRYHF